jgi:hypothetical protein
MSRSYAITVEHTTDYLGHGPGAQTLYVTTKSADLLALLHLLNASPAVASLSVCNTLTFPSLTKFANLTHNDLGIPRDTLEKLK